MTSYGDNFNASSVEASSVEASSINSTVVSVKSGGRLNCLNIAEDTGPGATTPGVPGDIRLCFSASGDITTRGMYYCTVGTGAATGNTWVQISQMNGGAA